MKATHVVSVTSEMQRSVLSLHCWRMPVKTTWREPQVCNSLTGGKEKEAFSQYLLSPFHCLLLLSWLRYSFLYPICILNQLLPPLRSGLWMWLLFWVFLHWLQLLYPWPMLRACPYHQGRHLEFGRALTLLLMPPPSGSIRGIQMVGPETSCHLLWTATHLLWRRTGHT